MKARITFRSRPTQRATGGLVEKPLQRHAGTAGELHEFRVADPPLLSFPLVPKVHLGMTLLAKFHFSGAEPGGEAQLRGNGDSQAQLGNECEKKPGTGNAEAASILSFAMDCAGAAHRVPEPLASRRRAHAPRARTPPSPPSRTT